MLQEEGVRLPGERRHKLAEAAERDGIELSDTLLAQLRAVARV
jgi:(2R)-3-sulfolactate dehydrogenase (NADP+)